MKSLLKLFEVNSTKVFCKKKKQTYYILQNMLHAKWFEEYFAKQIMLQMNITECFKTS